MRSNITSSCALVCALALGCGESASNSGATDSSSGNIAGSGGAPAAAGSGGSAGANPSLAGGTNDAGSGGTNVTGAGAGTGGSGGAVAGGGNAGAPGGGSLGVSGSGGATANPEGVPADYQLFIDQPFADAASLAQLRFADPQDWVHQDTDGGYIESTGSTYAPPYASPHALAIFYEQKFGAFVMEAEVIQTNVSGGHRDFCFAWGMESPSRFYYAHIAEAHDAVSHNIHIVLDADRKAITKTNTPGYDWGMNVWRKLRITRSASGDMAVYADGGAMPILTASDARLGAGYVGFGSFDDKGKVRNFKLWAPSSEKAPAGFFTAK